MFPAPNDTTPVARTANRWELGDCRPVIKKTFACNHLLHSRRDKRAGEFHSSTECLIG
jgi:hypothetical protein